MSRGGQERKYGRRRNANRVATFAGELAMLRNTLDGMSGDHPDFEDTLNLAEETAVYLVGVSTRMSRGSLSRRAVCERILAGSILPGQILESPFENLNPQEL